MKIPLIPYTVPEWAASDTPVRVFYRLDAEREKATADAFSRVLDISRHKVAAAQGREHDEDLAAQDGEAITREALKSCIESIRCADGVYGPDALDGWPIKILVNILRAIMQGEFDRDAPKS